MAMFVAMLAFTNPLAIPLFLPIQILWINLVTDGLPAIALGLEKTSPDVMERPPNDPDEPPVTRKVGYRLIMVGAVMAISTLLAFVFVSFLEEGTGLTDADSVAVARTAAFSCLVLSQLLYALSIRSDVPGSFFKGAAGNRALTAALIGSVLLMLAVVYLPGANQTFGMTPLGWLEWAVVIPLALMVAAANEVLKLVVWRSAQR
jgi:Ca2+-transporting ATPase